MSTSDSTDATPFTRIFIVNVHGVPKESISECFQQFGEVEDCWKVYKRDQNDAKEDRGLAYVKFKKASSSAKALLYQSDITFPSSLSTRPVLVKLATSKTQGSDEVDQSLIKKVYIQCPKSMEEKEIAAVFEQYGKVDRVKVVKDYDTKENRGFAFIFFQSFLDAAMAVENAPEGYQAVFSKPMDRSKRQAPAPMQANWNRYTADMGYPLSDTGMQGGQMVGTAMSRGYGEPMQKMPRYDGVESLLLTYPHHSNMYLQASVHPQLHQTQVQRLFDLCPGLENCSLQSMNTGGPSIVYLKYTSPQTASYAKDKLDGFEYPMGFYLTVRYLEGYEQPTPPSMPQVDAVRHLIDTVAHGDLAKNMEVQTLMHQLLAKVSGSTGNYSYNGGSCVRDINDLDRTTTITDMQGGYEMVSYCDVPLPCKQSICPPGVTGTTRLYVVFHGNVRPTMNIVKDVFCRFGNFVDFYFIGSKRYGYALFAGEANAQLAISTLHGAHMCDCGLKVVKAEDKPRTNNHMIGEYAQQAQSS